MMAGGPFPSHKGGGSAEAWKDLSSPEAFTKAAGLHSALSTERAIHTYSPHHTSLFSKRLRKELCCQGRARGNALGASGRWHK